MLPENGLDLSTSCSPAARLAGESLQYELVSVCHHTGRLEGGHYTATCRLDATTSGSSWIACDDTQVSALFDAWLLGFFSMHWICLKPTTSKPLSSEEGESFEQLIKTCQSAGQGSCGSFWRLPDGLHAILSAAELAKPACAELAEPVAVTIAVRQRARRMGHWDTQ